jgi:hypothetical protein
LGPCSAGVRLEPPSQILEFECCRCKCFSPSPGWLPVPAPLLCPLRPSSHRSTQPLIQRCSIQPRQLARQSPVPSTRPLPAHLLAAQPIAQQFSASQPIYKQLDETMATNLIIEQSGTPFAVARHPLPGKPLPYWSPTRFCKSWKRGSLRSRSYSGFTLIEVNPLECCRKASCNEAMAASRLPFPI